MKISVSKCLALICLSGILLSGCSTRYVVLKGEQFRNKDGQDFFPLVCNYLVEYLYLDHDTAKLILSPDRSVDGWCYNCTDLKSCLDEMSGNFTRIREMGFNGIRLFGSNPNYYFKQGEKEAWRIKAYDLATVLQGGCDNNSLTRFHEYYFNRPVASNPTAGKIFALIDSVLSRAGKAGLYVILVSGGGAGDYTLNYPRRYAEYLECLANHIHTTSPQIARDALIAYDLDNEPSNSWSPKTQWPEDTVGHTKQDVYNNVQLFDRTVKKADPDHLTTLGGRGIDEVFEYDPSILTVDFYSIHLYPLDKSYDPSPFQNKMDRVQGHFFWLSNVLKIPFIVGETGFRSEPGGTGPDGTNEEQKRYAKISLDMARSYGGTGYSWWNYQDYNWGNHDGFYGLTYWDGTRHALAEKPVADVFREFDPGVAAPAFAFVKNYYDPFNHRQFNPDRNHLSGHIQDQDGKPVRNAYIQGWTPINRNSGGTTAYEPHYTFSDENGDFTIIPYDSDPVNPPNTEKIVEIRVTAAGYSRFKTGWYDDENGVPPGKVKVITLEKLRF